MSSPAAEPEAPTHEAVERNYFGVCLVLLLVLLLMLLRRGVGPVALLPIVPALLGVVFRWGFSPLLTFLLLAGVLFFRDVMLQPSSAGSPPRIPRKPFGLTEWVLCGAFLGYVIAHYRLLGLHTSLFPSETPPAQKKPPTPTPAAPPETGRRLFSPYEISWLVLSLPIWAFVAQVCWKILPSEFTPFGLDAYKGQGLALAWAVGVAGLLAAGFLGYLGRQRWTRTEAQLFLQDQLWHETRREQQRISRRLVWARLTRRRKEKP
jgi:hypothetical protein